MRRRASCRCGQLTATCAGEPVRVSICHCLACQQRSGSAFAAQARFAAGQVRVEGRATDYVAIADSGARAVFSFCPTCGSTVYYRSRPHRDLIAIPIGAFADPDFPAPAHSVYEDRRHAWVAIVGDGIEHHR